jgi:hypothetical protein
VGKAWLRVSCTDSSPNTVTVQPSWCTSAAVFVSGHNCIMGACRVLILRRDQTLSKLLDYREEINKFPYGTDTKWNIVAILKYILVFRLNHRPLTTQSLCWFMNLTLLCTILKNLWRRKSGFYICIYTEEPFPLPHYCGNDVLSSVAAGNQNK